MARKKRRSKVGLKSTGKLKKGYKFLKGGRVVKVKAKRKTKTRRRRR